MTHRLQARLETLYGLERRKDKLGLDGTRAILAALGDPHRRFRSIHVAGTNGKGSVCAIIERVLREAGHRTGLYTSPHLVDFRERIRVGGRWADDPWLEDALDRIERLPEAKDRTFFEVATALGFLCFAEHDVDLAVVEVGLGGRLDSTNVLTPELSVITAIGLDHTEILGDTIEVIAAEKAGIVKPGVPVVCEDSDPRALAAVASAAKARGAPLVPLRVAWNVPALVTPNGAATRRSPLEMFVASEATTDADGIDWRVTHPDWGRLDLACPLRGRHQVKNLKLALTALGLLARNDPALDARAVREGVARVRWPGRLEPCPHEPRLWWDGAHNVAGVSALVEAWARDLRIETPGAVVLALSRDKDVPWMLDGIAHHFPRARVVATRTTNARALDPEVIRRAAAADGLSADAIPELPRAVEHALAVAGSDPVLLTGSLFAVGEAMQAFGGAPEALQ
ncbi:MAG TPA: folylpolyglutamate synthase/dihydrofolate synthase family protein [Candidatus Eisenbacteria bacterium]|nr:folylpolyglutamate synthase/dihydrofolate synthase family protein [Candidatus Eisenbacteria bacterium]